MTGPSEPEPDAAPSDGVRGGPDPATPSPTTPPSRRPPHVLAAAVLGFVVGLYLLLNALVLFVATQIYGAIGAIGGLVFLTVAAANVWGAVQATTGRGSGILRIGGLMTAGLGALGVLLALTQGAFSVFSLSLLAVGAGIYLLLNQPASKQYFAARGTR